MIEMVNFDFFKIIVGPSWENEFLNFSIKLLFTILFTITYNFLFTGS